MYNNNVFADSKPNNVRSIVTDDMEHCLISGAPEPVWHHLLEGTGCRHISNDDGLVIPLKPMLHNEPMSLERMHPRPKCAIHFCPALSRMSHMLAQLAWERQYLINKFGKQYGEEARNAFLRRYGKKFL